MLTTSWCYQHLWISLRPVFPSATRACGMTARRWAIPTARRWAGLTAPRWACLSALRWASMTARRWAGLTTRRWAGLSTRIWVGRDEPALYMGFVLTSPAVGDRECNFRRATSRSIPTQNLEMTRFGGRNKRRTVHRKSSLISHRLRTTIYHIYRISYIYMYILYIVYYV